MWPRYAINGDESLLCVSQFLSGCFFSFTFFAFVPCVYVWIWNGSELTQRENLPKKNAVWPHITQGCVQVMEDAFWCHPFQRQECLWKIRKHCSNVLISSFISVSGSIFAIDRGNTYAAFWDVVGVVHDVSGQAKVTDLHKFALTDQHISCREVSMDALRREWAEYCFHTWDFMPFMHQGQGHGRAVWVHGMLSQLAASKLRNNWIKSTWTGTWLWSSFRPLRSWRRGTPSLWPPGSWSPEGRRRSEQESRWWPGPPCPHLSRGGPTNTRGRRESKERHTDEWIVWWLKLLLSCDFTDWNALTSDSIWYSRPSNSHRFATAKQSFSASACTIFLDFLGDLLLRKISRSSKFFKFPSS